MGRLLTCVISSGHVFRTLTKSRRLTCSPRACYHMEQGVYGYIPQPEPSRPGVSPEVSEKRSRHSDLVRLVDAYRAYGHRKANLDPLGLQPKGDVDELQPALYGLSQTDKQYDVTGILHMGIPHATLEEVMQHLERTYCGPLTAEFTHLPTLEQREWFAAEYEALHKSNLEDSKRVQLAELMLKSQAFDYFLGNKFQSVKRYGGEGAESAMCFYEEFFRLAAIWGMSDVIVCIAHRGRLNLLTCLLNHSPVNMFRKMRGKREFPQDVVGAGDVLSHLTSSTYLTYGNESVHVTMLPNPSHLEAVNPVAVGKARGRAQTLKAGDYNQTGVAARPGDKVVCLQIHGDGAFSAQGVIAETFSIADTAHYRVGGSVHLIINNQLGYTAQAAQGRSGLYCSDVGKMNACPVIHVNADHPEEVVKAAQLALAYRKMFRRDVIVDLVCFRRHGHNELDEAGFTQPLMYSAIRARSTVPDTYVQTLKDAGLCTAAHLDEVVGTWTNHLAQHLTQVDTYTPRAEHLEGSWAGMVQAPCHVARWDTGVDCDVLRYVGARSVEPPVDMVVHPTLHNGHCGRRIKKMQSGTDLDWATAEALAFGSLLLQGYNVRLSGQDVGRGTFSQRHAMFVDQKTDAVAIPLNNLTDTQTAFMEVCNSALSEEAVLGFEYGMSIESPHCLVIWEAQFGDFFNAAQIIIDTFITGGETKWLLQSGLVMLLPHGMDGAGPEHSSCRLERFLQLTDSKENGVDGEDVNMAVVNPTTPAQYFHLMRRQIVRPYRKPLVVASPKMLLRHPLCISNLNDMAPGTSFTPVLADTGSDPAKVTRVILVSGKHYFTLLTERNQQKAEHIALIRIEELCPFPAEDIRQALSIYTKATDFVWSQEEHRNLGAWTFINPRMENVVGRKLRYVGRDVHATPAVGIGELHQQEAKKLIESTFM